MPFSKALRVMMSRGSNCRLTALASTRADSAALSFFSSSSADIVEEYGRLMPSASIADDIRSEEHTSELQSQSNLVCRLLLENKKRIDTHLLIFVLLITFLYSYLPFIPRPPHISTHADLSSTIIRTSYSTLYMFYSCIITFHL